MPIWKRNVCYRVLQLSKLPRYRERSQTVMCCLEWLGRSKCLATGLDVSLSFLSISRRCSQNQLTVVFLFHQCITFCASASYAVNDISRDAHKVISDLNRSLGPLTFSLCFEE